MQQAKTRNSQTDCLRFMCLIAIAFCCSCGPLVYDQSFTSNSTVKNRSHIILDGDPFVFPIQDPGCTKEAFEIALRSHAFKKTKLWVYDAHLQKVTAVTANLEPILLGSYSKIILGLTAGMRVFSKTYGPTSTFKIERVGKELFFCRTDGYDRFSAENVALVMLLGIQQVMQSFDQLKLFKDKTPPSLRLWVQPIFYESREASRDHLQSKSRLNNAFWVDQTFSSSSVIALLPHSKEYLERSKIFFSDTPAVFSHEFGHHLFSHFFPRLELRSRYHTIRALNEAWADVIASYSYDSDLTKYAHLVLEDQTNSRSVFSKVFNDKSPKIITEDILRHLQHPKFQDALIEVHYLGSILAYIFRQFLDQNFSNLKDFVDIMSLVENTLIYKDFANDEDVLPALLKKWIYSFPVNQPNCLLTRRLIPSMIYVEGIPCELL